MKNDTLKWKVCGMRESENIKDVLLLKPDFMGFIFYPLSGRYVSNILDKQLLLSFPEETKKVAVVVNQEINELLEISNNYGIGYFQLHGEESVDYCRTLKKEGLKIIKAFSIDESFDFNVLNKYESFVDYFLFDTKASGGYGGHGIAFDWSLLKKYKGNLPYLLAGGVDISNISEVKNLKAPFWGVDVNSKFELKKGLKSIQMLKSLRFKLEELNSA